MNFDASHIDKNSPLPLYYQSKSLLLDCIKSEELPVGTSIPAEKQLTEIFKISRATVRQAINELIQEGWLYRDSTKGTYVCRPAPKSTLIRSSEPFNRQITKTGQIPRTEVLKFEVIEADEWVAGKLKIQENDKVISIFRRRFADEVPIVTMQNYLQYKSCAFLKDHDLQEESLYEVLSSHTETKIRHVNRKVCALQATSEDVKLLDMRPKAPLLCIYTIASNLRSEIIEYSIMRYRGDLAKFEVDIEEPEETTR